MNKRKISWKEDNTDIKKMKMLENTQCVIIKMNDADVIPAKNSKMFNFKLTEKTAKSNILKAANRNLFEIESKQTCKNLRFSAGAYVCSVMPIIRSWCKTHTEGEAFESSGLTIKVMEFEDRADNDNKHFDTKVVFQVNGEKAVIHCYNSTQNLKVDGKMFLYFVELYLQPLFMKEIEANKEKIAEYDKAVIVSLKEERVPLKQKTPRRATRSVKNVRSVIQLPYFICKKCGFKTKSNALLKKHKLTEHTKSFEHSRSSLISVRHSTRNNSLSEEMLLCDDISVEENVTLGIGMVPPTNTSNNPPQIQTVSHICEICKHDARTSFELRDHMCKSHTVTVLENCTFCDSTFSTEEELKSHIQNMHAAQPQQLTGNSSQLRTVEHNCDICNIMCKTGIELRVHFESNHKETSNFKCEKCECEFKTLTELQVHTQNVHIPTQITHETSDEQKDEQSSFSCSICKHVATNEYLLRQHVQSTHQVVKVNIEKCEAITIHCDKCEYVCKYNIQLKNHTKNVHPNEGKFQCNYCGYGTDFIAKMYEHRIEDHKEIPIDFMPDKTTVKEMLFNLVAEQNMEILEEFKALKRGLKGSFEQLTEEIKFYVDDSVGKIENKIQKHAKDLEEKSEASSTGPVHVHPHIPQPSLTPRREPRASIRRKTRFLRKPKVLIVGDSITHNTNFRKIEEEHSTRIRTVKAYSATHDDTARWPSKNFTDVTDDALTNAHVDDNFTHLVLGAPSVDITNLPTSNLTLFDNTEVFKQKVFISCQNMVTVAENAVLKNPSLEKVVLMEHIPRSDKSENDPTGLKANLARFANQNLEQMCQSSAFKDKITMGKHNLDCDIARQATRYRDDRTGQYDGIHMYGREGITAHTSSMSRTFESFLNIPFSHNSCPQATYQRKQNKESQKQHSNMNNKHMYSVSVSNKYEVLGN